MKTLTCPECFERYEVADDVVMQVCPSCIVEMKSDSYSSISEKSKDEHDPN